MKRSLKRLVTLGATAAVALGLAVALPTTAQAATVGSLQIVPTTGNAQDGIRLKTSAPCPAGSVVTQAYIYGGPNNWPDPATDTTGFTVLLSGLSTNVNWSGSTGLPATQTIALAAQNNGRTLAAGTYNIQLFCYSDQDTINQTGDFAGTVTLAAAGANFTYTSSVPAAPSSTTTVSVPAAGTTGTPVNLSATVTATGLPTAATTSGSVQFRDGTTMLTTVPATVPVTGLTNAAAGVTVTAQTTFTAAGTKNINAVFVPTDTAVVAGSTSASSPISIAGVAATTTTTLAVSPAAPTTASVITLTPTVTPAGATGTVTYRDGTTVVGTSSATGSLTLTGVTAGAHSYTAAFAPTDPAAYTASTSAAVPVTVTAFSGYNLNDVVGGGETITATVPAGTLTLTAATTPVDLGTLALNGTNDRLISTGTTSLNPVTVTDTRPGQLGYTVSGIAGDFTSGATNKINSENLGWTPSIVGTPAPSMNVSPGPAIGTGNGAQVGVNDPGVGLNDSRVLVYSNYAASNNTGSIGTIQATAALTLIAPTNTLPGVYSTTLVITAI